MMKEVTRIHIAKVSYDIEIAAKKALENYIESVAKYADDEDVIEDVEIRITELLESRGVNLNGVVTISDVDAIQKTLGKPKDFSEDNELALDEIDNGVKKRLYRDIEGAVLGGVLAGMARYIGINALWLRLGFVVLLLGSFGAVMFIYILLWFILPAAKSVADKLLMDGKVVTVNSIRTYSEVHEDARSTKNLIAQRRRIIGTVFGIIGLIGVIGATAATVFGTSVWFVAGVDYREYTSEWGVLGLLITSGILLALLFVLISYSGFKARLTKKLVTAISVIIVAGLLSFSSAVGLFSFNAWQINDSIQKSITERSVTLPKNFSKIEHLNIDVENLAVTYQVSSDYHATLSALPDLQLSIEQSGSVVTVKSQDNRAFRPYQPMLTIYGPAPKDVNVSKGYLVYSGKNQDLKVDIGEAASVSLSGNYPRLSVNVGNSASIEADGASVQEVKVQMMSSSNATFGNVESLESMLPTSCPSESRAELTLQGVSTGKLNYNGRMITVSNHASQCGVIHIGSSDDSWNDKIDL